MKQSLIEYTPFKYKILNEAVNSFGKFIVEGPIQRADAKNQNGRIYPKKILQREVERYINEEIAENRALGELDHPDSSVINLKNASHNILEVWWEGNDLYGRIELLDTPSGRILKKLFEHNITVGISSRGMGSVDQLDESTVEVQDDFQLVCWDFVSNPSTHGAFMNRVTESVNMTTSNTYSTAHELIRDIICELSGVCCINK